MGDGKGKGLKSLLRRCKNLSDRGSLGIFCVCLRVCVWGGGVGAVVMEIRLSKNLAHQMDKH